MTHKTGLEAIAESVAALKALGNAVAKMPIPPGYELAPEPPADPRLVALRGIFGTHIIEEHENGFRVQPEKDVTAAVVARVVELMECAPEALVIGSEDDYSDCYLGEDPTEWVTFEVRR